MMPKFESTSRVAVVREDLSLGGFTPPRYESTKGMPSVARTYVAVGNRRCLYQGP